MQTELEELIALSDLHEKSATTLIHACSGEIFPCDALAFSVLERSLNLLKAFHLLLSNGCYTAGVGLLRMQLDSILRFYAVARSKHSHDLANEVINGVPLRRLKDDSGQKMSDKLLVSMLAANNPWVPRVYDLACRYIHLSDQHYVHFVARSEVNPLTGLRDFSLGSGDEHISAEHKIQLIGAFNILTKGILLAVDQWTQIRYSRGSPSELKNRFPQVQ